MKKRIVLPWTPEEELFLSTHYAVCSRDFLITKLKRSWKGISCKVHQLGLKRNIALTREKFRQRPEREWPENDQNYLKQNYNTQDKKVLINVLKRSWEAIKAQAFTQGLNRKKAGYKNRVVTKVRVRDGIIFKEWSSEEEEVLFKLYPTTAAVDILNALPSRSWYPIQQRAATLKIRRTGPPCVREKMMGDILDLIYPDEYHKDRNRYKWLTNPNTKRRLELDRYYPNLKLAFEYNGKQHYVPILFFAGGDEEQASYKWQRQQERDQIKRNLCRQYGVTLITIRYSNGISFDNIKKIIERHMLCPNL